MVVVMTTTTRRVRVVVVVIVVVVVFVVFVVVVMVMVMVIVTTTTPGLRGVNASFRLPPSVPLSPSSSNTVAPRQSTPSPTWPRTRRAGRVSTPRGLYASKPPAALVLLHQPLPRPRPLPPHPRCPAPTDLDPAHGNADWRPAATTSAVVPAKSNLPITRTTTTTTTAAAIPQSL